METTESSKKNNPWFLLWFPPILFFLVIMIFSIYFGVQAQGDANVIAEKTAGATPYILLTVQLLLMGIQFIIFRRQGLILRDLGWQAGVGKEAWKELLLGAVIGAPLGILWIYVIEPVLSSLQVTEGGTYKDSKIVCDWGDHSFLIAPHSLNPLYDVKTLEKQGSICPGDFYPWQKSDRPIVVNLAELS